MKLTYFIGHTLAQPIFLIFIINKKSSFLNFIKLNKIVSCSNQIWRINSQVGNTDNDSKREQRGFYRYTTTLSPRDRAQGQVEGTAGQFPGGVQADTSCG